MKLNELKSILKEIIKESLFGVKLKIQINRHLYPALISKNTRPKEKEYRLSWFDGKTKQPKGHWDFDEKIKDYILTKKEIPMSLKINCFQNGLPIPQLIFENRNKRPASYILVGTIDEEDGLVSAKYGGTHAQHRMRSDFNWRYNPYTEIVYWHNPHPPMYRKYVEAFIEEKGIGNVKSHIVLGNITDQFRYKELWNDAHGID